MTNKTDLIIFTDEDGMPWAAFVWGDHDLATVAAMITPEAVEEQTGTDVYYVGDDISWPPRVQAYWMKQVRDEDDDVGERWTFCKADDDGATRITGHRFYPQ